MHVCNEGHSAVVVYVNNSCPLCAMLDAFGKLRDTAKLTTTDSQHKGVICASDPCRYCIHEGKPAHCNTCYEHAGFQGRRLAPVA
jgi:hypothetical protein